MTASRIDIDRLDIALHGVSTELAEAAVAGLEVALRRRLGTLASFRAMDVPALRIDAVDLPPSADAAALRDLLADRLVQALGDSHAPVPQEEDA